MVHRKKQNRLRTILCESLEERRLMAATTQSLIASLAPEAPQSEAAIEAGNSSQSAASQSAANETSESSIPVAEAAPQNAVAAMGNPEVADEEPTGSDNSVVDSQAADLQDDGSQDETPVDDDSQDDDSQDDDSQDDDSQDDDSQDDGTQDDGTQDDGTQDDGTQDASSGTEDSEPSIASDTTEASPDESEASSSEPSEQGDSDDANASTDDATSDSLSDTSVNGASADLPPAVYENELQQSSAADDEARNELPAYSEARAIQESSEQELPAFSTAYPLPTDSQFVDANTNDLDPLNESPEEKIDSVTRTESTPIDNSDSQALPPGLRRGDALPPGLANRDELPYGLAKRASSETSHEQPIASNGSTHSETPQIVSLGDDTAVAESGNRVPDAPRVEPAEASWAVDSPAAVEGESSGSPTDANQVADSRFAVTDTSPGTQTETKSSAPDGTRSTSVSESTASNPAGNDEAANSIAANESPAEPQETAASPRENSSAFAGRGENERSSNNTSVASRQVTELPAASMSPDAHVVAQRNSSASPALTPPNRPSSNPTSPNRTSPADNLSPSNRVDQNSPPQNTIAVAPDAGVTSRGQLTTPGPASENADSPSSATSEFTASNIASNAAENVALNSISNEGQQPRALETTAPQVQNPPNVAARQALDVNLASSASEAVGAEAASPSSTQLAESKSSEQSVQNANGGQSAEGFKDAQGQFVRSQAAENKIAENQSTNRQFANHQSAARDEQSIVRQTDSAGIEVDNTQSVANTTAKQRNSQLPSADQMGEASPTPQQNGLVATDGVKFRYDAPKSLTQGMSNQAAEETVAQSDGRPDKGPPNPMRLAVSEVRPADLKSLIAQGIPESDAILALQKVLPVDQLSKLLPTSLVSSSGEQPTSPATSESGSSSIASIAQDMANDAEKEDGSASPIQPTVVSSSKLFKSVGASQSLRSEFAFRTADTMPVHATPNERERNATVQEPVANSNPTSKLNSSGNFRQTRLTGSSGIETKPKPTTLERIDRIEIEPGSHDSLPNEKHMLPILESQFANSRADDATPLAANDTQAEKSPASSAGVEIPAAVFFTAAKLNVNHSFRSLRKSREQKRTDD